MIPPPVQNINQRDTHRLVRREQEKPVDRFKENLRFPKNVSDLRKSNRDGVPETELASATTSCSQIINNTFLQGRNWRFSSEERGAWYAGWELETAQKEILCHYGRFMRESTMSQSDREKNQKIEYDDYMADFSGKYHDIRKRETYLEYLNPDPDSYPKSQLFAKNLYNANSLGIVYPSVRHIGGTCIVCFHPKLVGNVRMLKRYSLIWNGRLLKGDWQLTV